MSWTEYLSPFPGRQPASPREDREDRRQRGQRWVATNLTQGAELGDAIEVADHGPRRRKGLLGCDQLLPSQGLWIVPCEAVHTVGMRFAIDLIYLDRKRLVKKVCARVPPWRVSACLTAHSVLEVSAGTIARTKTRAGDQIAFDRVEAEQTLPAHSSPVLRS